MKMGKAAGTNHPFDIPLGTQEDATNINKRTIDDECIALQDALSELQSNLNSKTISAFGSSSAHSFSLTDAVVGESASTF